jgi:hypothetical protein
MRKLISVGSWSSIPSREESIAWAVAGVALAAMVIAAVNLG